MKIEYSIPLLTSPKTIKQIVKEDLFVSTRLLHRLKQAQALLCNGTPAFVTTKVMPNDHLVLDFEKEEKANPLPSFREKFIPQEMPLDILYEDEFLLVVNKSFDTPIHPSPLHYTNTLSNYVAAYLEKQAIHRIHIINRLDKDTSGVCLFAKHEYIQELFNRRKNALCFTKEYLAIADGILDCDHDIIDMPIARKAGSIILRETNPKGMPSKTEYFVLKRNRNMNYTCLRILLHTGRTHQIRVHMASIHHVLLGDDLYAPPNQQSKITEKISHQALHCHKISFYHPLKKQSITCIAPYPKDIQNLFDF